jgi:hypothetical protein
MRSMLSQRASRARRTPGKWETESTIRCGIAQAAWRGCMIGRIDDDHTPEGRQVLGVGHGQLTRGNLWLPGIGLDP